MTLHIKDLEYRAGDHLILKGINAGIDKYRGVVGLIGPNGAGKTTLIKNILGLAKPQKGEITLGFGRVAYACDVPDLPAYLTAYEILQLTAQMRQVQSPSYDEVLETLGLYKVRDRYFGAFSLGMRQRLGIACALIVNPDFLILDEPTGALDPFGRALVLSLIERWGQRCLVMVSSHLLDDIEHIATDLWVMNQGQLLYTGDKAGFLAQSGEPISCLTLEEALSPEKIEAFKAALTLHVPELQWDKTAPLDFFFPTHAQPQVFAVLSAHPELKVASVCKVNQSLFQAFGMAIEAQADPKDKKDSATLQVGS